MAEYRLFLRQFRIKQTPLDSWTVQNVRFSGQFDLNDLFPRLSCGCLSHTRMAGMRLIIDAVCPAICGSALSCRKEAIE